MELRRSAVRRGVDYQGPAAEIYTPLDVTWPGCEIVRPIAPAKAGSAAGFRLFGDLRLLPRGIGAALFAALHAPRR